MLMWKTTLAAIVALTLVGCAAEPRPQYVVRLTLEAGNMREAAVPGFAALGAERATPEQVWRVAKG